MVKQFKTERASQQQRGICKGLVDLMQTESYSTITVGDICKCAGIPRRTFYYYFNAKEDVLTLLIDLILKEAELETMLTNKASADQLSKSFTGFFSYWRDRRRAVLEALVRNGLEKELTSRCLNLVQTESHDYEIPDSYPPEMQTLLVRLGVTAVFYTLFDWCRNEFRQSPEYMAECVARLLVEPIYCV